MPSKLKILTLFYHCANIEGRGVYMEKDRKAMTLRVDAQLKFEIEKRATEEGYTTVNSWIIDVIKRYLEKKNVKK